jgi:hypothetical protein
MQTAKVCVFSIALSLLVAVPAVHAHEKYRVVGTVTKITAKLIDVKQVSNGTIVQIDVTKQTKVMRDKKPVPFNQIKVGSSVVVDGLGDDIFGLEAVEIRLVPDIPSIN